MRLFALAALGIALFFSAPGTGGAQEGCFTVLAADDLDCRPGACPGTHDAGGGVKFVLSPGLPGKKLLGPPASWMKISVLDGDLTVRELHESYYLGYARLDHNGSGYWMIGEYTGGMHCCARYHFFARPSPGSPLRYIGTTAGSAQLIDEQPFSCRSGFPLPGRPGHALSLFSHLLRRISALHSDPLPIDGSGPPHRQPPVQG